MKTVQFHKHMHFTTATIAEPVLIPLAAKLAVVLYNFFCSLDQLFLAAW